MDIGDKIKSRRNELGFTLKKVEDSMGASLTFASAGEDWFAYSTVSDGP